MRDIRDKLLKIRGMANAFRLIDANGIDEHNQLLAAKETGLMIEQAVSALLSTIPKE